jgi:formate hydrogenlyase subunit 3/multisubunit Na+/H+ antiporter MnhD subunit
VEQVGTDEVPPGMLVPIVILALGCIIFGIFVGIPLSVVEPAVRVLLGM